MKNKARVVNCPLLPISLPQIKFIGSLLLTREAIPGISLPFQRLIGSCEVQGNLGYFWIPVY